MRRTAAAPGPAPGWFRGYVFLGSGVLVAGLLLYTHNITSRLEQQTRASTRVLADFCASVMIEAVESESIIAAFRELTVQLDFPVVISDAEGRPYAWQGIGLPVDAVSLSESRRFDPAHPREGSTLARILALSVEMDRKNPPAPMVRRGSDQVLGYVHYGDSRLLKELRWLPFVELLALFVFVALGFLAFRSAKLAEQRSIWIGMAKETAHQLGTPISSLLGWVEMLKGAATRRLPGSDQPVVPPERMDEYLTEMTSDIERLQKVANRFSQVGSQPQRSRQDVIPLVRATCEYMRRRAPRLSQGVEIHERYDVVPLVEINLQLIEWVIENLLKNALDATRSTGDRIEVAVFRRLDGEAVHIEVTDNGSGIRPAELGRVFTPGYTTKQRGWGLGLTLAKRIIEDYHGGRIWVKESHVDQGTTIVLSLPT